MSGHRYSCIEGHDAVELNTYATGCDITTLEGDKQGVMVYLSAIDARDLGEQLIKWADRQEANG